jgi:glucan phosphoethanolaminetransferase (alkaline phosphatase superfamily)
VSYGETDDFAHDGKYDEYDEYIFAANRTDRFIRELWNEINNNPAYKDNTVLFITADHGRGSDPIETWQHHASEKATKGFLGLLA